MPVRLPLIKYDSTVWSDCYEFRKFAPSRTGGVTAGVCALPVWSGTRRRGGSRVDLETPVRPRPKRAKSLGQYLTCHTSSFVQQQQDWRRQQQGKQSTTNARAHTSTLQEFKLCYRLGNLTAGQARTKRPSPWLPPPLLPPYPPSASGGTSKMLT